MKLTKFFLFTTVTLAMSSPHYAVAGQDAAADEDPAATIRQAALEAGDPAAGEKVFKKCKACHMVGDGAKNRAGPILTGIVGSEIAFVADFKYSKAFLSQKEQGTVWTMEALQAFLTKPKDFIAKTKMSFRGIKSEDDRNNLIAYLAGFESE